MWRYILRLVLSAVFRNCGRSWNILSVDTAVHLYILIIKCEPVLDVFSYIQFTVITHCLMMHSFILAIQWSETPMGWENGQPDGHPAIQSTVSSYT